MMAEPDTDGVTPQQALERGSNRISHTLIFAWGAAEVCGDVPVPPDVHFEPGEDQQLEEEIGRAAYGALLAEMDRLHPGLPDNAGIADGLFKDLTVRFAREGADAAEARGCAAMRPAQEGVPSPRAASAPPRWW